MPEVESIEYSSLYSRNFDALSEASQGWDSDYTQVSQGAFSGTLDLVQIGSCQYVRETWSKGLRFCGTAPENSCGFGLRFDRGGAGILNGQPVGENDLISLAPGRESEVIGNDGFDLLVLSFDETELSDLLRLMAGKPVLDMSNHTTLIMSKSVADWMRAAGQNILKDVERDPFDVDRLHDTSNQFVKNFAWHLVQLLDGNPDAARPVRPKPIVANAVELALSAEGQNMGLVDIARSLNISLRRLQYAFEAEKGMSAATWLRILRLNQVRNELIQGADSNLQIKRVAANNGFTHLGHFAGQYKKLFGYLPSDTPQLRSGSL